MEKENVALKRTITELKELLKQTEAGRQQLQASYDEALQALADSEAKREIAEKELKIAQDQMATMWKELDSLHKRLDGLPSNSKHIKNPIESSSHVATGVNEESLELNCTLCHEKFKSDSPSPPSSSPSHSLSKSSKHSKIWPFGNRGKSRINQLDEHSKVCSSQLKSSYTPSPSQSPKLQRKNLSTTNTPNKVSSNHQTRSPLRVNVTRTPTAATDLAPFKVVTRTSLPQFPSQTYEVYRSAGDFQWLHDVLQESFPERIIPPLRTTISLDATVSEYQRFLSRLVLHKTLRTEQPFIIFLTGSIEELRILRAKFRPRLPSEDSSFYHPTQGRDTNSGTLVATKDYLRKLEVNVMGLVHYLQQKSEETEQDTMSHWFRQMSDNEPCDTYLKLAAGDLARTCQVIENHRSTSDGEDALCIQNLQSIGDYIQSAIELLSRVEEAVDKFLYWDEEVMICEAVTSTPTATENTSIMVDESFDDSGVSSVSGSSANSHRHLHDISEGNGKRLTFGEDSISEKWAQASSNCSDAKEYLEMMCKDLSEELALFDLQKEVELKRVFMDFAESQLDKNEKLQGKWFAMQCLLDNPIKSTPRAIQFVSNSTKQSNDDHSPSKKK